MLAGIAEALGVGNVAPAKVNNSTGLGNDRIIFLGTMGLYEAIRVLGADYTDNRGVIDFTIYANGGTISAKGRNGTYDGADRYVQVYINERDVYLKTSIGVSVSLVAIGAREWKSSTLPSGAVIVNVTPYTS